MKGFIKHLVFITAVCLLLFVLVDFAVNDLAQSQETLQLTYSVRGCEVRDEEGVGPLTPQPPPVLRMEGGALQMQHELNYVCCADLVVDWERNGDELSIIEVNEGELCKCLCDYIIEAEVTGFKPGEYLVKVFGVKYRESPVGLLLEQEIRVYS